MASSTTMTIHLSSVTKQKLERVAVDTRRSKSFLAAEGVSAYVEHELEIIDGIFVEKTRNDYVRPETPAGLVA
jgi:predicted transcriptional regulator